MLEEASKKCVYKELDEHDLCKPDEFPEKYKNTSDFVTCAGLVSSPSTPYTCTEC